MIEINLLPRSTRHSRRRVPRWTGVRLRASTEGLQAIDRSQILIGLSWVVALILVGWMIWNERVLRTELLVRIQAAALDSTRLAEIIKSTEQLDQRMRAVVARLTVVQQVDASRYTWAHLLDEIARALPEHTWLVRIASPPSDSTISTPTFTVEGRTGNNFALTRFLQQLEASPFIRQVRLRESQLIREQDKLVYAFALEASYDAPPPNVLETEPLFATDLDEQIKSLAHLPVSRAEQAQ